MTRRDLIHWLKPNTNNLACNPGLIPGLYEGTHDLERVSCHRCLLKAMQAGQDINPVQLEAAS